MYLSSSIVRGRWSYFGGDISKFVMDYGRKSAVTEHFIGGTMSSTTLKVLETINEFQKWVDSKQNVPLAVL